jgi:type IV secretory pathway component VirB8
MLHWVVHTYIVLIHLLIKRQIFFIVIGIITVFHIQMILLISRLKLKSLVIRDIFLNDSFNQFNIDKRFSKSS